MSEHALSSEPAAAYPLDTPKQVFTPETRTRRQWLKGSAGAATAALISYLAWTKYFFPRLPPAPATGTPLGAVSAFALGAPQVVNNKYIVERVSADQFRVLSALCTHNLCPVAWDAAQSKFACPCHGGLFDRTGRNVGGPPPSPLPALRSRVQGNRLYVEG